MRRSAATCLLTPDEVGCGLPPCKEIRARCRNSSHFTLEEDGQEAVALGGIPFCKTLRQQHPNSSIAVVLLCFSSVSFGPEIS
jgi:hypothetical protein